MLNVSVHVHDLQLYLTKNKNKNIVKAIRAVILKIITCILLQKPYKNKFCMQLTFIIN